VGLLSFALTAPQSGHAHRCTQFPGFRLLLTNRERTLEIGLPFFAAFGSGDMGAEKGGRGI